jgi:hypothetical protein
MACVSFDVLALNCLAWSHIWFNLWASQLGAMHVDGIVYILGSSATKDNSTQGITVSGLLTWQSMTCVSLPKHTTVYAYLSPALNTAAWFERTHTSQIHEQKITG